MDEILPLAQFITRHTGLAPDEAVGKRAIELLEVDRRVIAGVLSQISADLLSGNAAEASRQLTDAISVLRWDGKPS